MVTGRSPFAAATTIASMHAVLYERPPALTGSVSVEAVDRVVRRALEKRPADRYQSAAEMAAAARDANNLHDSGELARAVAVTRLVVLPFRVVPPDPDADFLAVGLADALTASLSGLDSMVVRSPLAAAGFGGPAPDLKAIATTLDVDAVLTATLMRAGDQLRVNAQLLEAPAGTVQWSHRSHTGLGDLFALQDDLTRQIVESLAVPLSRSDEQTLKRDVPASARAYEFYLRATQYGQTNETSELARDLYLQCLDEDPGYAPTWARLGRIYRRIGSWGDRARSAEYFEKAHAAFRRALELNRDLSLAHHLYAYLELDLGRAQEAMLRLLERATRHRTDPELLAGLVHALRYCGLLDASMAAFEKAERLDTNVMTSVCQTFWMLGDTRRAVDTERQGERLMGMLAALRDNQVTPVIAELKLLEASARGAELAPCGRSAPCSSRTTTRSWRRSTQPPRAVGTLKTTTTCRWWPPTSVTASGAWRCWSASWRADGSVTRRSRANRGWSVCGAHRGSRPSSPRPKSATGRRRPPSWRLAATGCSGCLEAAEIAFGPHPNPLSQGEGVTPVRYF